MANIANAHILKDIFSLLSPTDLAISACVCRSWRYYAYDDAIWKKNCSTHWPSMNSHDLFSVIQSSGGFYKYFLRRKELEDELPCSESISWMRNNGAVLFIEVNWKRKRLICETIFEVCKDNLRFLVPTPLHLGGVMDLNSEELTSMSSHSSSLSTSSSSSPSPPPASNPENLLCTTFDKAPEFNSKIALKGNALKVAMREFVEELEVMWIIMRKNDGNMACLVNGSACFESNFHEHSSKAKRKGPRCTLMVVEDVRVYLHFLW